MPGCDLMSTEREALVKIISEKIDWDDDISRALDYALNAEHTEKSRPRSVEVARRVLEMGTDRSTLIATLLSDPDLRGELDSKQIEEEFGKKNSAFYPRCKSPEYPTGLQSGPI